jgi:hypothetical protein
MLQVRRRALGADYKEKGALFEKEVSEYFNKICREFGAYQLSVL